MSLPPYLPLSSGQRMPTIGLGTWKIPRNAAADVIFEAIKAGYRAIDCACDYGNEKEVGEGIARALATPSIGVKREDLFITSKLWNTYHEPQHVLAACQRSLSDLGLSYLDLYLIHFPISQRFVPFETRYPPEWFFDPAVAAPKVELISVPAAATWTAMEKLHDAALVKNIGVCNFGCALLQDLIAGARIRPSVLQVELHPFLTQEKLLRFCRENGVLVTGFSPLGAGSYGIDLSQSALEHAVVKKVAEEVGGSATPAQILLAWGVQRGCTLVPKSVSIARLVENLKCLDVKLTSTQMEQISALNANLRYNDPGVFAEKAFNTFIPIYE